MPLTDCVGLTPEPLRFTVRVVLGCAIRMVSVAVAVPAAAGVKLTVTVHDLFLPLVVRLRALQLSPVMANGAASGDTVSAVVTLVPLLVTVNVLDTELAAPNGPVTGPKL